MYIELNDTKYINGLYVRTMERKGKDVYFSDKKDVLLGIKEFRNEDEAADFCEQEFCRMLNILAETPHQIENVGYDIESLLKEIKQIKEVLNYALR